MNDNNHIGVVILSAGASDRMGQPKSSLKCADGMSFTSKLVTTYREFGCGKTVVVVNPGNRKDVERSVNAVTGHNACLVVNLRQSLGRLYSLQLGIGELNETIDFCFVQDVDRPAVSGHVLRLLARGRRQGMSCSPKYSDQKGHPVLLSRPIMAAICACDAGSFTLNEILAGFPSVEIDTDDPNVLMNINTKEAYHRYINQYHSITTDL